MSGNSPTLAGLPLELSYIVAEHLSRSELLSLRLVSRQFARIAEALLAPLLKDRLRCLDVLVSKEGLQVLRGLTQIPAFRCEIRSLTLVGYAQYLLDPKLRSKQDTFVGSEELVELFSDCFRNFERGDKLLSISTGAWLDRSEHTHKQICGLRPLIQSLGGNQVHHEYIIKGYSGGATSWPSNAPEASFIPLQVMRDVQMVRKLGRNIARLEIALFDDGWDPLGQPADEPWQRLGELRELDIKTHKDARLFEDWTWVEPIFRCASHVPMLKVFGCKEHPAECSDCPSWYQVHRTREHEHIDCPPRCVQVGNGCKGCRALRRGLTNSIFDKVQELTLGQLAVDVSLVLHLIQSSKETLRSVRFEEVDLTSGSWRTVFTALLDHLPLLESLHLHRLYQRMQTDIEGDHDNKSLLLSREGRAVVVQCLQEQVTSFTVKNAIRNTESVTGKVFFTGAALPGWYEDWDDKFTAHRRPEVDYEGYLLDEDAWCSENDCDLDEEEEEEEDWEEGDEQEW